MAITSIKTASATYSLGFLKFFYIQDTINSIALFIAYLSLFLRDDYFYSIMFYLFLLLKNILSLTISSKSNYRYQIFYNTKPFAAVTPLPAYNSIVLYAEKQGIFLKISKLARLCQDFSGIL